jgi:hypothetical protein
LSKYSRTVSENTKHTGTLFSFIPPSCLQDRDGQCGQLLLSGRIHGDPERQM